MWLERFTPGKLNARLQLNLGLMLAAPNIHPTWRLHRGNFN